MESYDTKYDYFLKGSKYEVELDQDAIGLAFRQVKNPDRDGPQVKVNMLDSKIGLLAEAFPDIASYDLIKNHIHSGPMNLMESDNKIGVLYLAIGKSLLAFEKESCFELLTGNVKQDNIKSKILFHHAFKDIIGYVKVWQDYLIINHGNLISVFNANST